MKTCSKILFGSLEYYYRQRRVISTVWQEFPKSQCITTTKCISRSCYCGMPRAFLLILFILRLRPKEWPLSGMQPREKRNGGVTEAFKASGGKWHVSLVVRFQWPETSPTSVSGNILLQKEAPQGGAVNIFEQIILSTAVGQYIIRKPPSSCRMLVGR